MTDQLQPYVAIGKQFAGHERGHHGIKEFARGPAHVNTAESFNAILERAKQGVFHLVSRRHLPRYLSEVVFRWNNRDPVEKKRNGLSKIVMQAKPVLEQLGILLNEAAGTQLRRTIYGGVAPPQPLFGGEIRSSNHLAQKANETHYADPGSWFKGRAQLSNGEVDDLNLRAKLTMRKIY